MNRNDVEELIDRRLCSIETAIPAKVRYVNSDGTLSVEALIKKVSVDGIVDVKNLLIDGVKPFVVGNKYACIDFGIVEGSQVMLVSLSRHGREWLNTSSDDAVIPKSPLGMTLNDLFAVPISRGDRENGQKSVIKLGEDGKVEIKSSYGQSVTFNKDGSIEMSPKSGSKVTIKGNVDVKGQITASDKIHSDNVVEGMDFVAGPLKFVTHVHTSAVGPTSTPTPS